MWNDAPADPAPIPYGRQWIDEDDIAAVVAVLRSDWLTTGPVVKRFEAAFAATTGARHAVAVSSGTAALHAVMAGLGLGPGDEVVVPPMTFAATANAACFVGARPVFADVDPDSLLLDPAAVEAVITPRTRALVAVDYAGQPCDYARLRAICDRHGLALVADACHSLGASYQGRPVGTLADVSLFSLHPVKPVTAGEGGMITTDDAALARCLRRFRHHGIDRSHEARAAAGHWAYAMVELGYNYRLSELHAALGLSQLGKLAAFQARRQAIADRYAAALADMPGVQPLHRHSDRTHAWHLFVVQVAGERDAWYQALQAQGIGVNVHYWPVHLHPYYREHFATGPGDCPVAEAAAERILSLPLFPRMSDVEVARVLRALAGLGGRSSCRAIS